MTDDPIGAARRWFADELRYTAWVQSPAVVEAFATVPRERFSGPGPWRLLSPMRMGEYWTTEDADPRHLYHDVLVAIDETRRLNNGQPGLWACLYDQLGLATGQHVVHVGVGTGYYTAILAEIVGRGGHVTGIEIDPGLAEESGGTAMSFQKQLLLQVAAALNSDDFDHVDRWFTADFKLHEPGRLEWPVGHEGARRMLAEIRDKLPGVKVEALDMLEEGDRVAVRWLFSATREGEPRHLSAVAIYRFADGLISEDWGMATRAPWP